MKIITGFFMAWGNFISLPCPYKKWDSQLKNTMLAFLPLIGAVVGVLWMGLLFLLTWFGVSVTVLCFLMEFYIFAVCGFMHMDGFMDCNDAILSRRPLEERQRILKDSTVGAFAVVAVAFLLIGWYAAMSTAIYNITYVDLLIIPVISRAISGISVLSYKPIGHSQYVTDYVEPGKWKYKLAIILQVIIVVAAVIFLGNNYIKTLCCTAIMIIVGGIVCLYARKQLGGMSGDIAGYTICISEFAGILALTLAI